MAKRRTKQAMTESLPAFRCEPSLKEGVVQIAEREGRSVSEIQRQAMQFFLHHRDTKCVIGDTESELRNVVIEGGDAHQ